MCGVAGGAPQDGGEVFDYWGERWIVLPNPAYGSWDSALYGYDFTPAPEELLRRKAAWLRGVN